MTLQDASYGKRVRYGKLDAVILDLNPAMGRAQIRITSATTGRRVLWVGLEWLHET